MKQVMKTLKHRKGAPPPSPDEEEDGLEQAALLDGKDEYGFEDSHDIDSYAIVRTNSLV